MLHRDSPALIGLLGALAALGPISTDMYLASLPALTRAFGTDVAGVQMTLSAFLFGFALAQLFVGPMSDRVGRRPLLMIGLGVYSLAALACALAPGIDALVALRFLQAVGACAGVVLGRAIVRDLHERERAARTLAYVGSVMAIVPAATPVLGGYLYVAFGWQSNFLFMAAFGLVLLVLVWRHLDETNQRLDPGAIMPPRLLRNFAAAARHRLFVGYTFTIAFCYAGLFSFISGSSFVLIGVFGIAETHYGYFFGSGVIGYVLGTTLGGRLTQRVGMDRMLLAGSTLVAGSGIVMLALVLAGIPHWATVVIPMIFYLAGMGMVLPLGMAGALSPFPHMAGTAAALAGFTQMMVAAVTGMILGRLHDSTALPMAGAIAFCGLVTFAVYRLIVWPARHATGPA